jgi:DNA-binding NtrC family response regulator
VSQTIAVVDDELDTLQLFKEVLKGTGYTIVTFNNPILAIEYIKKYHEQFRIVLTDYRMEPITGYELAHKIIDIDKRIQVIIITALNSIGSNPLKLQIYYKPLSIKKLLDIVK